MTEGVRITRKAPEFIPSGEWLRPLRDYLIVRPEAHKPKASIEVVERQRETVRGTVVAAGPGTHPWIYNRDRSQRRRSKHFVPTQVKPGDLVELGGWEIDGYIFPQVMVNGHMHFICQEQDVCGIVEQ